MAENRGVAYVGPGTVEVQNIDFPIFELQDGPGEPPDNVGRSLPHRGDPQDRPGSTYGSVDMGAWVGQTEYVLLVVGSERLTGPHRAVTWPTAGAWLEATCAAGHASPARDCDCGVHGWHPRQGWVRRIVAARREIPGIVPGERGDRGPRRRLPSATGASVRARADRRPQPRARAPARGRVRRARRRSRRPRRPPGLVRGARLGLEEAVVTELLGPAAEQRRRARVGRARADALRTAAAVAGIALLLLLGVVATDSPGDRVLYGRTGEVHGHR